MKILINRPTEVDVKYLKMSVAVRYGEEDIPKNFPFRENDMWNVTIDIDKGEILNWPPDAYVFAFQMHMKVTDQGTYELQDEKFQQIAIKEEDYVPHILPGRHYGDYIILDIEPDGKISNWEKVMVETLMEFFDADE